MAAVKFTVEVKWAWWVWPYIRTVQLFAALHGLKPDVAKVTETVMRGCSITIRRAP